MVQRIRRLPTFVPARIDTSMEIALPYQPPDGMEAPLPRATAWSGGFLFALLAVSLGGTWGYEIYWRNQFQALQAGAEEYAQRGHQRVRAVAVSPDGAVIATGVRGGDVKLWNLPDGIPSALRLKRGQGIRSLAFSPEGAWLAAAGGDSAQMLGQLRIWDRRVGVLLQDLEFFGVYLETVAFSPNGDYFVATGSDGQVRVWQTWDFQLQTTLQVSNEPVTAAVFSPDSRMLAVSTDDGSISLWLTREWQKQALFQAHEGMIWSLAFAPGGEWLASVGDGGEVRLWNPDDPGQRRTLGRLTGHGRALAFSPDGRSLAAAGGSVGCPGDLRCWDVATGGLTATLTGHTDVIYSLAWSSAGELITGSADETVRVWNPQSPAARLTIPVVPR